MDISSSEKASESPGTPPDRREFFKKGACLTVGGVVTLAPAVVGVRVLVDPLFEASGSGTMVRLTSLEALPEGGPPQLFKVAAERRDGWTRRPLLEMGSVFLQRTGPGARPGDFRAFNSTCPHLGCAVEYLEGDESFSCPCHQSTFALTGGVLNPESPSPRGLDSLRVEIRGGDLWVEYLNFKRNTREKLPIL